MTFIMSFHPVLFLQKKMRRKFWSDYDLHWSGIYFRPAVDPILHFSKIIPSHLLAENLSISHSVSVIDPITIIVSYSL